MARVKTGAVAAVAVGVAVILGARALTGGGEVVPDAASPTTPTREGCSSLVVASSPEKAGILSAIAGDYNEEGRGTSPDCVTVTVEAVASGDVEASLVRGFDPSLASETFTRPDVWTPAADTWLNLLRFDQSRADVPTVLGEENPSITSTPLVLALPRPMAEALGWPEEELGWSDLLALSEDPRGWGAYGHPEWGAFTLGKTNPYVSTSGLAATVGSLVASTGRPADLTSADVADPAVRADLEALERSVVHYGDTTLTFLENLREADERGRGLGYVSAVAVEEKSVVDYDAGDPSGARDPDATPPETPLVAVYPEEGTLLSNSPYAVLDAEWVTDEKRAGAADFLAYVLEDEQQERFVAAGFRSDPATPPAALVEAGNASTPASPVVLSTPSPAVLSEVRAAWDDLRKSARVNLVIDESGSMDEPADGVSGTSKMELAKDAAVEALGQLRDTDEVGLWGFTTELEGGLPYEVLVPVAPLGENHAALVAAIESMQPKAGTPLYGATRAAFEDARDRSEEGYINGVVLLTDGRSDGEGETLDSLLDGGSGEVGLREASREADVRVFTVAYGEGSDLAGLTAIAEATEARAYDATDAGSIDRVFRSILSNF